MRSHTVLDQLIQQIEHAIQTCAAPARAARPSPSHNIPDSSMNMHEQKHAAGLMRVNHTGEVCAQGLYQGQACASKNPANKALLLQSAHEEVDHLAWTEQRLIALNSRTSYLNPLWYAGSFGLGFLTGQISEALSLGFVIETENQVSAHLQSHLNGTNQLPAQDECSRAIVNQMNNEEIEHAQHARDAGGVELPNAIKIAMAGMAKVMTTTAYLL